VVSICYVAADYFIIYPIIGQSRRVQLDQKIVVRVRSSICIVRRGWRQLGIQPHPLRIVRWRAACCHFRILEGIKLVVIVHGSRASQRYPVVQYHTEPVPLAWGKEPLGVRIVEHIDYIVGRVLVQPWRKGTEPYVSIASVTKRPGSEPSFVRSKNAILHDVGHRFACCLLAVQRLPSLDGQVFLPHYVVVGRIRRREVVDGQLYSGRRVSIVNPSGCGERLERKHGAPLSTILGVCDAELIA